MLLGACAAYGKPLGEVASEVNATLYAGPTLIEPGDFVDLRFPRKSEWNQTAGVRPDGCLSFPLIGELRVAGTSIADLKRSLDARYQAILDAPDVTINLESQLREGRGAGSGIVVSGEVATPGLMSVSGERLTLIDALGRAGGQLKATALLGNTLLLRRSPRTGHYAAWHIDARVEHWGAAEPIYLQRHDMIFVPNTPIDDVNIWVDQYLNRMIPVGVTSFALGIVVGNR
jgi:polysaccharide export outer membrane protein